MVYTIGTRFLNMEYCDDFSEVYNKSSSFSLQGLRKKKPVIALSDFRSEGWKRS